MEWGIGIIVFGVLFVVIFVAAYMIYDSNGKKNATTPQELEAHNRKMEKIDKGIWATNAALVAANVALDRANARRKQSEINQYNEQVRQYNQQVMRNQRGY